MYRYDGTQWLEEQKLAPGALQVLDGFGCQVAISGNVILAGAHGGDPGGVQDAGEVYVFRYNGTQWVEEQVLSASDKAVGDQFGPVAVSGNLAVVGAGLADMPGGFNEGAASVFRFNGTQWVEEQKLTASDAAISDEFGRFVATDGTTILIGAPSADVAGNGDSGAVYAYAFDGTQWVEEKITPANSTISGAFGATMDIDGDKALIGARDKAYVFRHNGQSWVEQEALDSSDGHASDGFGAPVSLSDTKGIVGAALMNGSGAACLFSMPDLALSTNLATVMPGDALSFFTCGGRLTAPVGLFLVDANGALIFLPIEFGLFDGSGQWTKPATVPPGLAGLSAEFLSMGFIQPMKVGLSDQVAVTFQ